MQAMPAHSAVGDQALTCIKNIFDANAYKLMALDLKGKVEIEQEDYENAMISFNHAFTTSGDPKFLLWEAYALYLLSEFRSDVDEKTQRKLLHILIKRLERLQHLALKHKNQEIREQTLYYLGCSYSRYKDYVTAIGKLRECLQENTKSEVSQAARSLLEQDWNQTRPPLWRWWLHSPSFLNSATKKVVFIATLTVLILIILFFLFHPFITILDPSLKLQADWSVYLVVAGLLIIILLFPSIENIKTKDLEIKMHASSPLEPFPSPAMMEKYIELWPKLGDGVRKAAYRGGWKPA
jgi:tetratricopeptide (TPR) repeat protein